MTLCIREKKSLKVRGLSPGDKSLRHVAQVHKTTNWKGGSASFISERDET